MKKLLVLLLTLISLFSLAACTDKNPSGDNTGEAGSQTEIGGTQDTDDNGSLDEIKGERLLGGLSPADALEYMKNTPNIVIVQVNTAQWKIEPGFTGALWIPHDEMATRYNEIPTDRPVILHCGGGIVSVPAYETLIEKRPDIPQLSYVAGSPHSIINAYNEWLASQN